MCGLSAQESYLILFLLFLFGSIFLAAIMLIPLILIGSIFNLNRSISRISIICDLILTVGTPLFLLMMSIYFGFLYLEG